MDLANFKYYISTFINGNEVRTEVSKEEYIAHRKKRQLLSAPKHVKAINQALKRAKSKNSYIKGDSYNFIDYINNSRIDSDKKDTFRDIIQKQYWCIIFDKDIGEYKVDELQNFLVTGIAN